MSIDLPASIERDLERYAKAEYMSAAEAAVKFIRSGLKASKRKSATSALTEAQMEQLKASPTAAFFGALPDHVLDQMEKASKQIHAERFTPRG